MKTHDLAQQIEAFAKTLRSMPNVEIGDALSTLFNIVNQPPVAPPKHPPRPPESLPEGIEARLTQMTPAEVEAYLTSETEAFSTSRLLELAERLGVSTSKRQSRSALINLITRHFEARQMDAIIRSARKSEK